MMVNNNEAFGKESYLPYVTLLSKVFEIKIALFSKNIKMISISKPLMPGVHILLLI